MARKKRYFPKKEDILKGTGYDSLLEKTLHETVLSECEFHKEPVIPYTVSHTYEPDFVYIKDGKKFLIEVKGRFQDSADARRYTFIRESLPDGVELVFIMQKAGTRFPFARKRKDGTYATHEDWFEKHGFRHWNQFSFSLDLL